MDMQNRRLILWCFAAVVLVVLAILFLTPRVPGPPVNSITARYIGENGQSPSATRSALVTLWVTNKTQQWLNIQLAGIEVLQGSAWTNYLSDGGGWLNSPRFPLGHGIYSTTLPPRSSAFGLMHRFGVPETSPWRLKLSVSEQLRGPRHALAGIKAFLSTLTQHGRLENPFPSGLSYTGEPRETVSETVYVNLTNKAVALP
jgi:hypothetical protein